MVLFKIDVTYTPFFVATNGMVKCSNGPKTMSTFEKLLTLVQQLTSQNCQTLYDQCSKIPSHPICILCNRICVQSTEPNCSYCLLIAFVVYSDGLIYSKNLLETRLGLGPKKDEISMKFHQNYTMYISHAIQLRCQVAWQTNELVQRYCSFKHFGCSLPGKNILAWQGYKYFYTSKMSFACDLIDL